MPFGCTRRRPALRTWKFWLALNRRRRVVVTFDKDFGELAFRLGAAATFGVVLFRINAESPDAAARAAVAAFATRTDWSGVFVVVEDGRIRVRALVDPSPDSPADENA